MQKIKVPKDRKKPNRHDDIDLHNEIEVLDKPNKYYDIDLHNKVTGEHIKKKFLANLEDCQVLAHIMIRDEQTRTTWLTAVVDTYDFEQDVNKLSKFLKLQVVQTLIKEKHGVIRVNKGYEYELDEARWVDGMLDYHSGQVLKYRTLTEYIRKEDIRSITLEKGKRK